MANIIERRNKKGEITSYRIRVSMGYDINKKQIIKAMTWYPPEGMSKTQIKKELAIAAAEFEKICMQGQCVDDRITFKDLAEMWLRSYAEFNLKRTTLQSYKALLPNIYKAIGHISIGKIQPHHLNEFYAELMGQNVGTNRAVKPLLDFRNYIKVNDGVKRYNKRISQKELSERADVSLTTLRVLLKGDNINAECAKRICSVLDLRYQFAFEEIDRGRIKASTVKRYHALISSICTFAVYQNIIMVNPCTRVKPPRVCKKEAEYLDEEETNKLLNALQTTAEPFRTAIQLLLFTGMRRGELCGLEWQDVDFDKGILRVCRTLLYTSETGVFEDTPKNYSSVRSIRISEYVVELLREYKKWQEDQSKRLGTKWIGSTKIFTNEFGAPLHPSTTTRWFANFNEKNGLKKIPLHSLRHTSATLLIMSGVPVNVVSKRLGHNNTSTTMSIYTHVLRSADALAAEALDNVILSKVKDKKNETASD